jgi:K+ transporter
MVAWRKRFFIALGRTRPARRGPFKIPSQFVVELGTHVDL